jgi:hypothetical protein
VDQFFVGLDLGQRSDPSALCVLRKRMVEVATATEPASSEATVIARVPETPVEIAHGRLPGARAALPPRLLSRYDCQLLQRFDLHVPYPEIVERVCGLSQQPELDRASLVVDWTGVGTGVVDYFRRARREPVRCPKCGGGGAVGCREESRHDGTGRKWEVFDGPPCVTCGSEGKIRLRFQVRPVYITAGSKWTADEDGWRVSKQELVSVTQMLVQSLLPDGLPRLRIDPRLRFAQATVDEFKGFKFKITESANITYEAWRGSGNHADLVMAIASALWVGENQSKKMWMKL